MIWLKVEESHLMHFVIENILPHKIIRPLILRQGLDVITSL